MPGILGIISRNIDFSCLNVKHNSLSKLVVTKKTFRNLYVEQFVTEKFLNDKIFEEDEESLLCLEGVVFNFKHLLKEFAAKDYFTLSKELYQRYGDEFFKIFRGEFSGVFYNKIDNSCIVFTNHTGTKRIFYYQDTDMFIFSSELKVITQILRDLKRPFNLDENGAYFMLTYGYMLEDYTIIKEIKKLGAGSYITYKNSGLEIRKYYTFENSNTMEDSREKIIDTLDELFKNAIRLSYDKDIEYGYGHISTLSGGLDSRMEVMMAKKLGYNSALNITCAQSNYLDERIAKEISRDLNNNFLFYALDNGNYLKNPVDAVMANDGLVLFSGAAHLMAFFKTIDFKEYGLLHTGQLGDGTMGSYLTSSNYKKPEPKTSGAYSVKLLDKITQVFYKIALNYESEEIFKFNNRVVNGMWNGDWMVQQFTEFSSPFCDVDFVDYALRIPPQYKYKEKLYIDWIKTRHPDFAAYKWEKIGIKPTNSDFIRLLMRIRKKLRKLARGGGEAYSMNPFDYWYRTNNGLRESFTRHFEENIGHLDGYDELQRDCSMLFNIGSTGEKSQVLTLLHSVKLHF